MDEYAFRMSEISLRSLPDAERVGELLARHGLRLDGMLERYYGVRHNGRLIGGAGYGGNVIKCVAVDNEFRGEGVVDALVSRIMTDRLRDGVDFLRVFTKPENEIYFAALGFRAIESNERVLLMESDRGAFGRYLRGLERFRGKAMGAVVMNANPFTLGHQYLAGRAASLSEKLLLFIVREDVSAFPFKARLRLAAAATAHLPNVEVLSGGPYMISAATFPTYFFPDSQEAAGAHAALDIAIFGKHICPAAGITRRFAGEEPYSPVTRLYNETMLRDLPPYGVDVKVFPRREVAGDAVSASRVRQLLAAGHVEAVRGLVPETTYRYLSGDEARPVLERLQAARGGAC